LELKSKSFVIVFPSFVVGVDNGHSILRFGLCYCVCDGYRYEGEGKNEYADATDWALLLLVGISSLHGKYK